MLQEKEETKGENQPTMTTSTIPEEMSPAESITPPTALNDSSETQNTQHNPPSKPEIGDKEAVATASNPPVDENLAQGANPENQDTTSSHVDPAGTTTSPKLDDSVQLTNSENQKTLPSPVPETTGEVKPLSTDASAQIPKEMTENQQKLDLANIVSETSPESRNQDSARITNDPPTETSKQDSADVTTDPSPEISKQHSALISTEPCSSETSKPDSADITTEPSTETAKQEPTTITQPQSEILKQDSPNFPLQTDQKTNPVVSKKDSICLPLPGLLHRLKDKHLEPKKPALVQEISVAPSKEISKAPTSGQSTASSPSKDAITKKSLVTQQDANISTKDELSKSIDADINFIKLESSKLGQYKDHVSSLANDAAERFEELKKVGTEKELRELKKEVTKLKLQIPSKHKGAEERGPHKGHQDSKIRQKIVPELLMKRMPQLYKSNQFDGCSEVRDFERLFDELSGELKLCLMCFSIFPENVIIKKRLMLYWWIAEGFVPPIPRNDEIRQQIEKGKTVEEFADEFFEQLTKMGFIEPVNNRHCLSVGCYKMHPFVRLALIMIAEREKFFNFDEEGMPTEESSGTFQACLMGRGLIDYQDLQKGLVSSQDLEKLHVVFNVNEPILEIRPDWFMRMKNLSVLYLGRWKVSATDHIEVEEADFLDGLSSMEHLRFFSLQGVSRIMELPDAISQLMNLIILDLRACHSLESIPEGICSLRNLTYLDLSECYLLEHMPKGLAFLSNLKVFKGFVVGEEQNKHTCCLDDLAKLKKLIKLTIYTGLSEFPNDKDIAALQNFTVLKKLTIAWGGSALHTKPSPKQEQPKQDNGGQRKKALKKAGTLSRTLKKFGTFKASAGLATTPLKLEKLEKLDLKSFPKTETPTWLMPSSLPSLKKLYIRGGKFSDLGQYQEDLELKQGTQGHEMDTWNVEILRVKYLSDLEMDWRKLLELFPNLVYLEKVNCPKLSFFPTDGYGVWINKQKLKQMQIR
ncbi:OLC1v1021789C1 [Oldenlandia corymbosa var. corymbosa]|uniref:OLC1v1021789C1 n=1 Tax=Oldenlandia corymbosa var. corymbosa TaxID=529605 RepID=A0AAV1BYR6_OLDCO|nr:OLC1v1021789C1 [Oldenlandia corymbosa var. corymbosa]